MSTVVLTYTASPLNPLNRFTPDFLNKKHIHFDQGLDFLKFGQGNRGPNQQNRRKTEEKIRNGEETRRNIDKTFRDRDPYFLLNIFLLKLFSVLPRRHGAARCRAIAKECFLITHVVAWRTFFLFFSRSFLDQPLGF